MNRINIPELNCCGNSFESTMECIIKGCISLLYYYLSNPEAEINDKQREIGNTVIRAVEKACNNTCLVDGEKPKTMEEVLNEFLKSYNPETLKNNV